MPSPRQELDLPPPPRASSQCFAVFLDTLQSHLVKAQWGEVWGPRAAASREEGCWCVSVKHQKIFSVCIQGYCSRELFLFYTCGLSSYTGTGGQRQHKSMIIQWWCVVPVNTLPLGGNSLLLFITPVPDSVHTHCQVWHRGMEGSDCTRWFWWAWDEFHSPQGTLCSPYRQTCTSPLGWGTESLVRPTAACSPSQPAFLPFCTALPFSTRGRFGHSLLWHPPELTFLPSVIATGGGPKEHPRCCCTGGPTTKAADTLLELLQGLWAD